MTSPSAPAGGAVERHAPYVAGALISAPTLLAHYPPMSDLPLHEGIVGLLRHWGDDAYLPPQLYTLNFGHANQLFHVLAWGLSYVVGTLWACKLVVAAAQFLIFSMGARFADHLGRSRWGVLLLAPLALGFTYYWGLVANLIGFAALLGVLPAIDRSAATPSVRRAAGACGLVVLVFFAHEAVFIATVGLVGMLAIAYPLDRRKTPLRLVPVAFAVLFMGAQWVYQQRSFTRGQLAPPAVFDTPWAKVQSLPDLLFGSHDTPALLMLLAIGLVAALALVSGRVEEARAARRGAASTEKGTPPPSAEESPPPGQPPLLSRLRAAFLHFRFEITAVGFLFFYFVMPLNWRGATLVYARFLGPAWALLVICAAPRKAPRIAKLTAGVLPVAILLLSWPSFLDSDRMARDLDVIMEAIPLKSSVALVAIERRANRRDLYSASVGPARVVATRGGRVSLAIVISPLSAVQIRPEYRWDEMDARTLWHGSRALKPSHDLDRFGWVIAQSRERKIRELVVQAMKPEATLVMEQGEWLLFRSEKPQAPLTSPDVPAPAQAQTVLDRVMYLWSRPPGAALPAKPEEAPPP